MRRNEASPNRNIERPQPVNSATIRYFSIMNFKKNLLRVLLTLALIGASSGSLSALTIVSNTNRAILQSPAGSQVITYTGTSFPTSQTLDATDGVFYSRSQIDYTGSGDNATFLEAFSHNRSGGISNISATTTNYTFTVDTNTTYALSGMYDANNSTSTGFVSFTSQLTDRTAVTQLSAGFQSSNGTIDESFVLGTNGGDLANFNHGSLTGILIAGHEYEWLYSAYIQVGGSGTDGGASAFGFMRLDIGGGAPTTVPDNGPTLALLGLSLAALTVGRRKVARA
jgi:hypothetical protein